jgi:DNA-binding LacI/PurR family transcriptional regulator
MGFDNTKNAKWAIPEITTVAQPQDQIGYEAADILIDLIKGEQRGDLLLRHEILQRDSVSCKRDIE